MGNFPWAILSAVVGNVLIGTSFALNKRAQSRLADSAGNNHHKGQRCCPAQMRSLGWWLASILFLVGEVVNFCGYLFLPVYAIVLLGSISVIMTQGLSIFLLHEPLTSVRVFGTITCLLGAVAAAIPPHSSSPSSNTGAVLTFVKLLRQFSTPRVVVIITVCATVFFVLLGVELTRRCSHHTDGGTVSLATCLLMYSSSTLVTIVTTKAIGLLLHEAVVMHKLHTNNVFAYLIWPWWAMLLCVQFFLLNMTLRYHQASQATPLLYIAYTLVGLCTSVLIYDELGQDKWQLVLLSFALVLIIIGVWMVTQTPDPARGFWPWCCPRYDFTSSAHAVPLRDMMAAGSSDHSETASTSTGATNGTKDDGGPLLVLVAPSNGTSAASSIAGSPRAYSLVAMAEQ